MTEPELPPSDGAAPTASQDPVPQQGETLGQQESDGSAEPLPGDALPPAADPAGFSPSADVKRPSYLFLGIVSTLSVVADLGTKIWAEKTLVIGAAEIPAPKVIIKGVLTFFLAKNRGGAWGFLQHQPERVRKPFFVLVSVLAIMLLVGLYRRVHPEQRALKWGLPLVFGGAVGNLVDRIRYGHVIDFIDVQATWKGLAHHWPTFNVADIAICVGVALMAVDMFTPRREVPGGSDPRVTEGGDADQGSITDTDVAEQPHDAQASVADEPHPPLPPAA